MSYIRADNLFCLRLWTDAGSPAIARGYVARSTARARRVYFAAHKQIGARTCLAPSFAPPLCDLLGIEYPVISAGMGPVAGGIAGPVATAPLAAAVSNAGGLGVIGGAGFSPERLREEINRSAR